MVCFSIGKSALRKHDKKAVTALSTCSGESLFQFSAMDSRKAFSSFVSSGEVGNSARASVTLGRLWSGRSCIYCSSSMSRTFSRKQSCATFAAFSNSSIADLSPSHASSLSPPMSASSSLMTPSVSSPTSFLTWCLRSAAPILTNALSAISTFPNVTICLL